LSGKRLGEIIMWSRILIFAAALVLAPLGAKAADLVVWWEQGFYPEEEAAVREIMAAFEQETGKTGRTRPVRPI
jgi:ABC-type glycerol-3-phosphate transport system substrate-binding protein